MNDRIIYNPYFINNISITDCPIAPNTYNTCISIPIPNTITIINKYQGPYTSNEQYIWKRIIKYVSEITLLYNDNTTYLSLLPLDLFKNILDYVLNKQDIIIKSE